jgi:Arc/MetJ-type ribon-helix-helix transcriptional regulator
MADGKDKPEPGLQSAGFLPFDIDEYINVSSLGRKGLSKILKMIGKEGAEKITKSAAKETVKRVGDTKLDDAIQAARKSKALREAMLKVKREKAAASGLKDPNKWLGTMDRGDPNIKQPGNDPVFMSREWGRRPYGSGMPKRSK